MIKKNTQTMDQYIQALVKRGRPFANGVDMYEVAMDVTVCERDKSYQTDLRINRSSRLAKNWDIRLCDPIQVSYRGGHVYVFNGWHRLQAAKALKLKEIQATLYLNLTLQDEINLFLHQEKERLNVRPRERFLALKGFGDPRVCYLDSVMQKYNFSPYLGRNQTTYKINAIGVLMEQAIRLDGDSGTTLASQEWTDWLFGDIFDASNWGCQTNATSKDILLGLTEAYIKTKNAGILDIATQNLVRAMRPFGPDALISISHVAYAGKSNSAARMRALMLDIAEGKRDICDLQRYLADIEIVTPDIPDADDGNAQTDEE